MTNEDKQDKVGWHRDPTGKLIPPPEGYEQSDADKEAAKKTGVSSNVSVDTGDPDALKKYTETMEKGKGLAEKVGMTSFADVLSRAGSDGVFAQQVITHLVTGDDAPTVPVLPDSPQELNVTGKMDYSTNQPRRHPAAISQQPPTKGVAGGTDETTSGDIAPAAQPEVVA